MNKNTNSALVDETFSAVMYGAYVIGALMRMCDGRTETLSVVGGNSVDVTKVKGEGWLIAGESFPYLDPAYDRVMQLLAKA